MQVSTLPLSYSLIVGQVLSEKELFFRPIGIQWVFYFQAKVPLIIHLQYV